MKKIIILIIAVILLSGCDTKEDKEYSSTRENWYFATYVDEDTCVEYFASEGSYNKGTVSVKYNADGTIKINKKCMEGRKNE